MKMSCGLSVRAWGALSLMAMMAGPAHAGVVTLAGWTFETSQPTSAGSISPEVGNGSGTIVHSGGSIFYASGTNTASPSGNGSQYCWGSTGWIANDTNYFQFQTSTTGYAAITLAFDQLSSNTGPNGFALEYSVTGSNFVTVGAYTVHPNGTLNSVNYAWNKNTVNTNDQYTFDLSAVQALNNATSVYFRLAEEATAQASNPAKPTVSGSGYSFVDNVRISGTSTQSAIPEPASLGLLGVGALCLLRRRTVR